MSVCMTPARVKYLHARLLQESSMSVYMTPAGVKYVAQEFQCMTPAGVKYFNYDSSRSQVCQYV